MARKQKEPAIIFMVTGIIPLVPGGLAYDATKNLVLLNFQHSNQYHVRSNTYCRRHRIRFIIRRPNFQINCFWVREIF